MASNFRRREWYSKGGSRRVLPFERRFVSAVSLEAPPRSVVVAVIRGTGLKRKLEEFRALPCWESVSRADPLFCRSLRIRPTPVSHADALFLLSLSPFSPKQRDFLGKWPRSCPKWQRVVNAVSPRFSPLDSCPPLLAPTCQLPFQCLLHLSRVSPSP